jgi:hypothetical protein
MNTCNNNLMQETSVIKKIVENDSFNGMLVESKMVINSNQIIKHNAMNSNKNIILNIK